MKSVRTNVSLPERPSLRGRRLLTALVSLGPIVILLSSYGLLVDHVPEAWFTAPWLRYLFCGVCALVVALLLRLLGQRLLQRRSDEIADAVADESESVAAILAGTRRTLLDTVRDQEEDGVHLLGWSQYFRAAVAPTAIGTSYGLRLINLLGIFDSRLDRARLLDTVKSCQQAGGGWCASSQRDIARPEPTAWVLSSAARAGLDLPTRTSLTALLESLLDSNTDRIGAASTSVVTSVVSTLAELAPRSARLSELVERLVQGATQVDEKTRTMAWGATLNHSSHRSVAHTARAVCALTRVIAVSDVPRPELEELVDKAVRWLRAPAEQADFAARLSNTEEQVRRPMQGNRADVLVIGNFTAAWVARAFLATDVGPDNEHLRTAVGIVCRQQEKGIWKWDDQEPVWMTYQGAVTLKEYSLRCLPWPP